MKSTIEVINVELVDCTKTEVLAKLLYSHLSLLSFEKVVVAYLDGNKRLSALLDCGVGMSGAVYFNLDELIICAHGYNAIYAVFAHNHPDGSLKASQTDINTTRKLIDIMEFNGVKLLDHLIFTKEGYVSMANTCQDITF